MDDFDTAASGAIGDATRPTGLRSVVATPIVVEGKLWGTLGIGSANGLLPVDTASRLEAFTDLMATAIANMESRARAERLANEQAALRRVATMIAREAPAEQIFARVTEEVGTLLEVETVHISRADPSGVITIVGSWSRGRSVGRPQTSEEAPRLLGFPSTVSSPITVHERPSGAPRGHDGAG